MSFICIALAGIWQMSVGSMQIQCNWLSWLCILLDNCILLDSSSLDDILEKLSCDDSWRFLLACNWNIMVCLSRRPGMFEPTSAMKCPWFREIVKLTGIGKSMCHKLLGIGSFDQASGLQQHQIHSATVVDILLWENSWKPRIISYKKFVSFDPCSSRYFTLEFKRSQRKVINSVFIFVRRSHTLFCSFVTMRIWPFHYFVIC